MNLNIVKNEDKFFMPESQMQNILNEQSNIIWLNSFGGCGSNYFASLLEKAGWKISTQLYQYKLCHYYKQMQNNNIKFCIFLYIKNIEQSIASQIKRNYLHNYFKCSGNNHPKHFSIINWLNCINDQIDNWTDNTPLKTYIINFDAISTQKKYRKILLSEFGINSIEHKHRDINTIHYLGNYNRTKPLIDKINKKLDNLPDFQVI